VLTLFGHVQGINFNLKNKINEREIMHVHLQALGKDENGIFHAASFEMGTTEPY